MDNFTFPKDEKKQGSITITPKNSTTSKHNKVYLKYLFVGIIILILIILSSFVKGKIYDREYVYEDAKNKISSAAGDTFFTNGFSVSIPWESSEDIWNGGKWTNAGVITVPASTIIYNANLSSESRSLGIYSTPIFTGTLSAKSTVDLSNITTDKRMKLDYSKAWINFSIKDTSLLECPDFIVNNEIIKTHYNAEEKSVSCYRDLTKIETLDISSAMNIRGSQQFRIFLNSTDTVLNLKSDWVSPGFTDFDFLPAKNDITESGFNANWSIPFDSGDGTHSIGFSYIQPVDLYTKLLRSVNYGFLFIIVPFIVLFMFEVFAKINLHPMNYLLSGAASVLFFLLLLSISEHLSFGLSYLIGAFAAGLLVSLYVCWITNKKKLGIIMCFVFLFLYTYLYVCLMSEDYALLMGSIFAFILLAVIMFITRNINWSNLKKSSDIVLI